MKQVPYLVDMIIISLPNTYIQFSNIAIQCVGRTHLEKEERTLINTFSFVNAHSDKKRVTWMII